MGLSKIKLSLWVFTSIFALRSITCMGNDMHTNAQETMSVSGNAYKEALSDHIEWTQSLQIDRVLFKGRSKFQNILIFENPLFDKVLVIDDIIQLTSATEAPYHEMMVHVPLIHHGNPKRVLIIGGGDGGVLREVVRYPMIEKIVQVELDEQVVELCKKYIPSISQGAYDDKRVHLVIKNAVDFVRETDERFDIIICDSTDYERDPSEILFGTNFFQDCKKILKSDGIFVNQNGTPFVQKDQFVLIHQRLKSCFKDASYFLSSVPLFGDYTAFSWATDCLEYKNLPQEEIEKRWKALNFKEAKYYTPKMDCAAFALPAELDNLLVNNA